jgi:hypothetical protein
VVVAELLPVFLMAWSTTSVMHPEAATATPATSIALETTPPESTTTLETSVLLKLTATAMVHILLRHSLVKMALLVVVGLTIEIIRSASCSRVALASSVVEVL